MTRLRGASVSSYDASRSPTGADRSHLHRSKLPPNAPDVIVENTIDVSDPAQVLLWYRDERRRQFNLLVRRYKNQLLYGCQDPTCCTPTCASYRRRVSEGPYRRYTELSARTLACYLASLDDPEAGLCRNNPRVHSEFSSHNPQRLSRHSGHGSPPDRTGTRNVLSPSRPTKEDKDPIHQAPVQSIASSSHLTGHVTDTLESFIEPPEQIGLLQDNRDPVAQRMKDAKSFTQNLFDTLSLRMVEWLPLRRLPDVLGTDSSRSRPPKREVYCEHSDPAEKELEGGQRSSIQKRQTGSVPHTPSSRDVDRLAAGVETKPNSQIKRIAVVEADQHHSQSRSTKEERLRTELRSSRKLSINAHISAGELTDISSPPALKHRQQKHRGRFEDLDGSYMPEQQRKERRVSWDSAKFLDDAQNSETQKSLAIKDEQPHGDDQLLNDPNSKCKSSRSRKKKPLTVQTLTHIDDTIIDGLQRMLIRSEEDAQRWKDELAHMDSTGNFESPEWQYATLRQRQVYTFVAQSVFYALGNPKQILRSFHDNTAGPSRTSQDLPTTKLNLQQLQPSLRKLLVLCPWDMILHSLWRSMESLFVPPKELSMSGRQSRRSSTNSTTTSSVFAPILSRRTFDPAMSKHVDDVGAADIATIALFTLVSSLPAADGLTWRALLQMRAAGTVASTADMEKVSIARARSIVEMADRFDHELALRLVDRLVRGLTARLAFHEISKVRHPNLSNSSKHGGKSVVDLLLDNLGNHYSLFAPAIDESDRAAQPPVAAAIIAEWLRTLFLRNWDGNSEIPRSSSAGGAVEILSRMYRQRNHLGLVPEDFHTPFLSERLDPLEMPVEWLSRLGNNKTMHLLSYSFLFPPSALVIYFRALNYSAMSKAYEAAMTTTRHVTQTAFGPIPIQDDARLLAEMKTTMTSYLVLMVRRDNVLTDALNQLWRREKRELLRPLKVQMGMDEGEEGLDHGGVQQEFFRVVMAEALDPSYGMFTMDGRTRISWFQPCSLEPLYKFELFGLLMSLAIYNGVTLPVNFPIAFYRKILGLKVKHLDHIQDGWPELSKGLGDLLTWQDGDVGDVFVRTYEFSFEAYGSVETVDMEKVDKDAVWPLPAGHIRKPFILPSKSWSELSDFAKTAGGDFSPPCSMAADDGNDSSPDLSNLEITNHVGHSVPTPPAEEASLVTNQNRAKFVKDYIFWLTDKSIRAQFDAFTRGFYTCLDRAALSIFTPEAFKTVVEGIQEIDINELERHARYEGGFSPNHYVIRGFWSIVRGYSTEKKARLLEFVTASDRVPVNGIGSIMFVIQKNGVGDDRLPTSLTCFGRLLLPEYSSKDVLEEKLDKALENARGFGVA